MTVASLSNFTRCGLPGVGQVPFGMHACHFYHGRDDLVATLPPYFVEGLRSNERCVWVTAPPLPACEAIEALRAVFEGADAALQANALRILDYDQWRARSAELPGPEMIDLWLGAEERALAEGYSGLRIAGNVSFLKPDEWSMFMAYERTACARFDGRRIVALCSYPLAQCDDRQISEVMHAHHCGFDRPGDDWQVVTIPKSPAVSTLAATLTGRRP